MLPLALLAGACASQRDVTRTFRLRYAPAELIAESLDSWVEHPFAAHVTPDGKGIVVTTSPFALARIEEVLAQADQAPRCVEIEAKFVEVSQEDLDQLGFEWFLADGLAPSNQVSESEGEAEP